MEYAAPILSRWYLFACYAHPTFRKKRCLWRKEEWLNHSLFWERFY